MPFYKTREGVYRIVDEDVSLVNSIRRIILSEIPTIAFDPKDVKIIENTGNLHNEFLTHRISMIPIHALPENYIDLTNRTFTLNVKNDTKEILLVTAADFHGGSLFPANPISKDHVLITKLLPGQHIHIECKPSIGISKQNARWCPVSKCSYMNVLDEEKVQKHREEWTKESSIFETHQKYRYFKTNKYNEPCEFEMYIESECALTPDYLIKEALKILAYKCATISDRSIVIEKGAKDMIELKVLHEDYTLINLVQALVYNKEVRGNGNLEFIGYYKPHPLEDSMVLKLKFKAQPDNIVDWLNEQCRYIMTKINEVNIVNS